MSKKQDARDAGRAVLDIDHKARAAAEQKRGHLAVRFAGALSEVGDQPQARILCAGVLLLGLVRRDARMVGAGARMLVAHEVATAGKNAVKRRVDRRRPRSASDREDEKPRAGRSRDKEDSSFPSGHSAGAMAVASAYSAVYPEHRLPAMIGAGAVAVAQIPRCAHYPSDVGAGLAVGAVSSGAVSLGWRALRAMVARWA
ncbi:membrane-associated phospholipid phosphatase [Novosphingobium chloroacetimidivorans]|uniref:Membrane-associated phospholipid phosphatase n=1 Tax=Novosphingobium chloroacetimidivorans TaxID=1428314 RepID=A0A7W7NY17_9SPHN|nr:phosphatase PAP2 family protein [Novosphingobium chloroacetimidivorans]MBB4860029.1 membrane-associated phospholipid phosphatase [Novosphingobium chloroacetimidivorans]